MMPVVLPQKDLQRKLQPQARQLAESARRTTPKVWTLASSDGVKHLYWLCGLESPPNIKSLVRKELGAASVSAHD